MVFYTIQSFRIKGISYGKILYALLLFVYTGCGSEKFPINIDDIDTLSVYQNHVDSLTRSIRPEMIDSTDTIPVDPIYTIDTFQVNKTSWTLCSGNFKQKANAKRMLQMLNETSNAFTFQRDSIFIVSLGIFHSKDSAKAYRKKFNLNETYPLKVRPGEILEKSLPD